MRARAGSKHLIREINEALVMDTVRLHGPVPRAQITAETGLSPATVTGITGKLRDAGYLVESGVAPASIGRPSRMLSLSTARVRAIGIRLSANVVDGVALNLKGEVVASHIESWHGHSPDQAAEAVVRVATDIEQRFVDGEHVIGVGVAVSGIVDHHLGVVTHSGALKWEVVPLRDLLVERLQLPVKVDNYVNAFALGRLLFGQPEGPRDILTVNVGSSIGMSLVINGKIYRGADGVAGGLAHTRVNLTDEAGLPCHCGKVGCLETVASRWGIERELARQGVVADPESLVASAADPRLADVLSRAGAVLGGAVANTAAVVGPKQVLMAVASPLQSDRFLDQARSAFFAAFAHGNRAVPELEVVTADDASWTYGAGCEVLADLFRVDVEVDADGG